jgi:hypothetical protein
MFKDTINPVNALNPMKKLKKVGKAIGAGKKLIDRTSPQAKKKLIEKLSKQEAV